MKLCNMDEEFPEYFYIFLNYNGILGDANWNNLNLTRRIDSGLINNIYNEQFLLDYLSGTQDYLPFIPNAKCPKSPTSFVLNIVSYYSLEYNLELYRKNNVGKYPSRLSAIFAFGDYETCIKVSKKHKWPLSEVRRFKLKDLERNNNLIRVSKHNMEIVSLMRGLDCRFFSGVNQNKIYEQYWNGNGNLKIIQNGKEYETGEIFEYLIEGVLELVEDD